MKCKKCKKCFKQKTNTQKFCSRTCGNRFKWAAYRKRQKEKGVYTKKRCKRYFDNPCKFCGNPIGFKDKIQTYCSLKCSHNSQKKFLDIPDCLNSASRKIDKNIGYVRVYAPMHSEANTWGYVYEHRLIAEEKILGRKLKKGEVVHHKNGVRWDNDVSNLEVMDKVEHAKLHGQRKEDLDK